MSILSTQILTNPYGDEAECIKFEIDDITKPFVFNSIKEVGSDYTLSTWIKAETTLMVMVNDQQFKIGTEWQKLVVTFSADSEQLELYFTDIGTYYMYHPKLEAGHKPTDWSPAPNDIDEDVANAQNTADSKASAFVGTYIKTETGENVQYHVNEPDVYFCEVDGVHYSVIYEDHIYKKTTNVISANGEEHDILETHPEAPYQKGDIWVTADGYTRQCLYSSDETYRQDDWTESTETVNKLANKNAADLVEANATIAKLVDKIQMLVVGDDGKTLWEQDDTGWTFSFIETTTGINSFNNIQPYIRHKTVLNTNGNPVACIEIGEEPKNGETSEDVSPFKVQITNEEIRFMENNYRVAWINNESLNIEKAVINDGIIGNSLGIGGIEFRRRANGNVGILWKGAE